MAYNYGLKLAVLFEFMSKFDVSERMAVVPKPDYLTPMYSLLYYIHRKLTI